MQFAQLTPGVVVNSSPRIVTAAEIVEFASRYDPQWMHVDTARAKKGRWKGLIASGWLSCSIAMELTVRNVLAQVPKGHAEMVAQQLIPLPIAGDRIFFRRQAVFGTSLRVVAGNHQ